MKIFFAYIAIIALWLVFDAPVMKTAALASRAGCAAWCANNARYKTPVACGAWCQANHCGS